VAVAVRHISLLAQQRPQSHQPCPVLRLKLSSDYGSKLACLSFPYFCSLLQPYFRYHLARVRIRRRPSSASLGELSHLLSETLSCRAIGPRPARILVCLSICALFASHYLCTSKDSRFYRPLALRRFKSSGWLARWTNCVSRISRRGGFPCECGARSSKRR
jgi:hypothetical protein